MKAEARIGTTAAVAVACAAMCAAALPTLAHAELPAGVADFSYEGFGENPAEALDTASLEHAVTAMRGDSADSPSVAEASDTLARIAAGVRLNAVRDALSPLHQIADPQVFCRDVYPPLTSALSRLEASAGTASVEGRAFYGIELEPLRQAVTQDLGANYCECRASFWGCWNDTGDRPAADKILEILASARRLSLETDLVQMSYRTARTLQCRRDVNREGMAPVSGPAAWWAEAKRRLESALEQGRQPALPYGIRLPDKSRNVATDGDACDCGCGQ